VSDTQSRFAWDWAGAWTGVFIANLTVPVLFGLMVVGPEGGALGLFGALAVPYWIGFILCGFRFRVGRSLVWGGGILAVSQVLPILQIVCGAFGLGMWDEIGGHSFFSDERWDHTQSGWQNDPNVGALVVTFFSAHPLLVLAVLIGATVRWYRGDRPIWFTRRADPDAELEPTTESRDQLPPPLPAGERSPE